MVEELEKLIRFDPKGTRCVFPNPVPKVVAADGDKVVVIGGDNFDYLHRLGDSKNVTPITCDGSQIEMRGENIKLDRPARSVAIEDGVVYLLDDCRWRGDYSQRVHRDVFEPQGDVILTKIYPNGETSEAVVGKAGTFMRWACNDSSEPDCALTARNKIAYASFGNIIVAVGEDGCLVDSFEMENPVLSLAHDGKSLYVMMNSGIKIIKPSNEADELSLETIFQDALRKRGIEFSAERFLEGIASDGVHLYVHVRLEGYLMKYYEGIAVFKDQNLITESPIYEKHRDSRSFAVSNHAVYWKLQRTYALARLGKEHFRLLPEE